MCQESPINHEWQVKLDDDDNDEKRVITSEMIRRVSIETDVLPKAENQNRNHWLIKRIVNKSRDRDYNETLGKCVGRDQSRGRDTFRKVVHRESDTHGIQIQNDMYIQLDVALFCKYGKIKRWNFVFYVFNYDYCT